MDQTKILAFIQITPEFKEYLVNDIISLIYKDLVLLHKIEYVFKESLNSPHIYVSWIGEYTLGSCDENGTRVRLKNNAAKSINGLDYFEEFYRSSEEFLINEREELEEEYSTSECDVSDESFEEFYRLSKKLTINRPNIPEGEFPISECDILDESLEIILKYLDDKIDMEIVASFRYVESIEELMKELDHHAGNNLYRKVDKYRNNVKDTDHIFINFFPIENVWIIQKKNEIIEELNYVLRKCNTKGVTWHHK